RFASDNASDGARAGRIRCPSWMAVATTGPSAMAMFHSPEADVGTSKSRHSKNPDCRSRRPDSIMAGMLSSDPGSGREGWRRAALPAGRIPGRGACGGHGVANLAARAEECAALARAGIRLDQCAATAGTGAPGVDQPVLAQD